jgi:hypothetical protein
VRGHDPEGDAEEIRSERTLAIVLGPLAVENQEDLVKLVHQILRMHTETTERPGQVLEFILEGHNAGALFGHDDGREM